MQDAFSVPSCPANVPEVSRGRRLPYSMSTTPAIGRLAHPVRFAPTARRFERHGASVPTRVHLPPASPPYSRIVRPRFGTWASPSTSYGYRARTGFPPAVWSHQSVGMAPDHAASGQLPHGRYDSAGTKAAPEKSCYHPCRCCAPGRFSAPSLPTPAPGDMARKALFGRFRPPAGSDGHARRAAPEPSSAERRAWRIAPAVVFAGVRAGRRGHCLRAIGGYGNPVACE